MAEVRQVPPAEPQPEWALLLTAEERNVLLAALDFARAYLDSSPGGKLFTADGHDRAPAAYQAMIDPIEQALANSLSQP